tara:strand:+ start:351 stop:461 length:111 start_codon:yes stop_codon:yes gene_type:complete
MGSKYTGIMSLVRKQPGVKKFLIDWEVGEQKRPGLG